MTINVALAREFNKNLEITRIVLFNDCENPADALRKSTGNDQIVSRKNSVDTLTVV